MGAVYKIRDERAVKDYKGCGKAWGAIKNGEIVGLRYMNQFELDKTKLPTWVSAIYKDYPIIETSIEIRYYGGRRLSDIKKTAIEHGHEECTARGAEIRAGDIVRSAQRAIDKENDKQFEEYRSKNREELSNLGDVVSGIASCYEFISN